MRSIVEKYCRDAEVEHITSILDGVEETVPGGVRDALKQLLYKYSDISSRDEIDLGCNEVVNYQVDPGDNRSFRLPSRQQSRASLPNSDKLLTEMKRQGVVEPCQIE